MKNNLLESIDGFMNDKYDEALENAYIESVVLGIGAIASTINEDNNHELIYDYLDEETINECIELLDIHLDEYGLDEEYMDECVESAYDYLNETNNIVDVASEKRSEHTSREEEKEERRKNINAKLQPHKERGAERLHNVREKYYYK